MTYNDPLYYPRTELAERLINSLKTGISHAFTLFAPRRMGKTKFLLNDIQPMAKEAGFNVFYFSFMEQSEQNIQRDFTNALIHFLHNEVEKTKSMLNEIKKIDVFGFGFERENQNAEPVSISQIICTIAQSSKPTLLLLDEAQELARIKGCAGLVRSLRTGLDVNQHQVKVIFTGSSTNGLRIMFNDSKAPFFHFAHHLDFPHLTQDFTDYLADIYQQRTQKNIDKQAFYQIFEQVNFTPLYMRSITQDMIVNPDLSLEQATQLRLTELNDTSHYEQQWQQFSELEKLLLIQIAQGNSGLYKADTKAFLIEKLGVNNLSTSSIQGQIRKLERKEWITRNVDNQLKLNDPLFESWVLRLGDKS